MVDTRTQTPGQFTVHVVLLLTLDKAGYLGRLQLETLHELILDFASESIHVRLVRLHDGIPLLLEAVRNAMQDADPHLLRTCTVISAICLNISEARLRASSLIQATAHHISCYDSAPTESKATHFRFVDLCITLNSVHMKAALRSISNCGQLYRSVFFEPKTSTLKQSIGTPQ